MDEMQKLERVARELVTTRIPGTRKGSDEPAFTHSVRVFESLTQHGFDKETCLAGLLHDILEDGDTKFEELVRLGFSPRVVELVCLCSHVETVQSSDARWAHLMGTLIEAADREAWAIKVADLTDNLKSAHLMWPDRQEFMVTIKGPLMLRLTRELLGDTPIWNELKETIEGARKRMSDK